MIRRTKSENKRVAGQPSAIPRDSDLIVELCDLLPGDVLLYRPRNPNIIQARIARATASPYTHAAIYLEDGRIADSCLLKGVAIHDVGDLLADARCVAVLRSQCVFDAARSERLARFVAGVVGHAKFYDFVTAARFEQRSAEHFENQLDFIRDNFGKVTPADELAKKSFICSAFIVACYTVVGIIGESAQVAYQPDYFSPGRLAGDPSFGWLLGFLVPESGSVPTDDPLSSQMTLWRDTQGIRWW